MARGERERLHRRMRMLDMGPLPLEAHAVSSTQHNASDFPLQREKTRKPLRDGVLQSEARHCCVARLRGALRFRCARERALQQR